MYPKLGGDAAEGCPAVAQGSRLGAFLGVAGPYPLCVRCRANWGPWRGGYCGWMCLAAIGQKGPRKAGLSGLIGSALPGKGLAKLPRLEVRKSFCLIISHPTVPKPTRDAPPIQTAAMIPP